MLDISMNRTAVKVKHVLIGRKVWQVLYSCFAGFFNSNIILIPAFCLFSSPSAAALGEQYFKKSVCLCVDNAFLLCLTSFYYLNEWSDTKLVNTIFVKTAEPHQAALDSNSYLY